MAYRVRSAQVAWFLSGEPPHHSAIFQALVGREADAFQRIVPPQAPFPVTVQTAVKDEAQHRVQSHIGRVDYFVEATGQDGSPVKYSIDSLLEQLRLAVDQVSTTVGPVTRMAIVLSLVEQFPDEKSLAKQFQALFDNKLDFSETRDLNFQFSRRNTEGDLATNNLLRWTGETLVFQQIMGAPSHAALVSSVEQYYMSYMIDVNTVPSERTLFSAGDHVAKFDVLCGQVLKLVGINKLSELL